MRVVFLERAWEEYLHWQQHDPDMLRKINELIKDLGARLLKDLANPSLLKARCPDGGLGASI